MNFPILSSIVDMAYSRKDYLLRLEAALTPIVIHLFLLQTSHDDNLRSHWKNEIDAWVDSILKLKLKAGSVESCVHQVFSQVEPTDPKVQYWMCRSKFKAEGLNPSLSWFSENNSNVNSALDSLQSVLISSDPDTLDKWIESL